jgi:hypothetical protein
VRFATTLHGRQAEMDIENSAPKNEEDDWEDMLCDSFCPECQQIFTGDIERLDNSRWFLHHQSLSAIESAVHENCYICLRSWTNATLKNADFFKSTLGASLATFSMKYQISFEHDARYSSLDGPHNTIRIVLDCNRQQDDIPDMTHTDNFLAFSSQGMWKRSLGRFP